MASVAGIRWAVVSSVVSRRFTSLHGPPASRMIQSAVAVHAAPMRVSAPGMVRGMATRAPRVALRRVGGMGGSPAATSALADARGVARGARGGRLGVRRNATQAAPAAEAAPPVGDVGPIPYRDLLLSAFIPALPWVAMGFIDNSVMLIAGSWLDAKLGAVLGLTALGAAAAGNMFSDVIGAGCASSVEDLVRKLGLPTPNLTAAQRVSSKVRTMALLGAMAGVALGCLLGDFPLLYIDQEKIAEDKRQAELKSTFDAVVEEVHTLMECQKASLWMIDAKHGEIYTKTTTDVGEIRLPMGKGIIGLALRQRQLVRVDNCEKHPAFLRRHGSTSLEGGFVTRACMTMPIFDQEGHVLGAIQVLNRDGPDPAFTLADEEKLRNLAKVVQIAVQHCYNAPDTKKESIIAALKQHATCPTRSRPSVMHKEHHAVEPVHEAHAHHTEHGVAAH